MRLTRLIAIIVSSVVAGLIITYMKLLYPSLPYGYLYAAVIFVGGVALSKEFSLIIRDLLTHISKNNALVISNVVAILGYVVTTMVTLAYLSVSPTAVLAGAAFSGLVLGLALQPTLGSFFAGLLILLSGAVRPGNQVRILGTFHFSGHSVRDTSTSRPTLSTQDTWLRSFRLDCFLLQSLPRKGK